MRMTKRPRLGDGAEFDRIRAMVGAANARADGRVILGPGDDAAIVQVPAGEHAVLSCDLSVEDVHFRRAWLTWEEIGWRATASALSDLAAMGARPLGALLAVALAPELETAVAESLSAGAGDCLRRFDSVLLGGDLSRSPGPAFIDVTVLGSVEVPLSRSGAQSGDEVWVTGWLGGAAVASASWATGLEPDVRARRSFARPVPRLEEMAWLRTRATIHAAIDLSDGLAGDAGHIAAASDARLVLERDEIPLHAVLDEFTDRAVATRIAATGGEDYELLLAVEGGRLELLRREFETAFDLPLTRIGRVEPGAGVAWVDDSGTSIVMPAGGFDHFSG
jgi:thiamine-monophosphate kinase